MKKNVSGQVIGAQMVSATDGSAFTGSVTVAVTGDGGTQATGSVGSGACTHEGNGFHTYAPAQAETDYDHVAFTFTGTGAIPVTVQLYTDFPQTGDAYARLGAPAGASVSADVAAVAGYVDTEVAAIKAKTDNLPSSFPTNFADLAIEATTGRVKLQSNLAKNVETTVRFLMKDSTNHAPATSLTVSVEVSTDGGAFASATNSASEEGNGWYAITLTATEMNGDEVVLHCTATGADDTEVNIRTDP